MSEHTHDHGRGVLQQLGAEGRELRTFIPEVYSAFGELHKAAMAEGSLDKKTKELIALAIGISSRCDGCVANHARGAALANATEAEVAETIGVAILMAGGPATVYGPRAFAAFREFEKKSAE
jgi:AhpD family alkylhydroperoxidase